MIALKQRIDILVYPEGETLVRVYSEKPLTQAEAVAVYSEIIKNQFCQEPKIFAADEGQLMIEFETYICKHDEEKAVNPEGDATYWRGRAEKAECALSKIGKQINWEDELLSDNKRYILSIDAQSKTLQALREAGDVLVEALETTGYDTSNSFAVNNWRKAQGV